MGLEIFQKQEKVEKENSLEVVVGAESLRDKKIADLIALGKTFYSDKKDANGNYVSVPDALRQALTYAGGDGFVASMPEFVAAKCLVDKSHVFWKQGYGVLSEEDIGVDREGLWVKKGEPVLVVVHGGGILTPDRIEQAYNEGLINGSAKYDYDEFGGLLEGKLSNGNNVKLYSLDDLKRGISIIERNFGIVIPYQTAQATEFGYHKKKAFLGNPLVLARIANMNNIEAYFDKAKDSDWTVGNWHPFKDRSPNQAQGRLLFLNYYFNGLLGYDLLFKLARFSGVSDGGT